MQAAERSGTDLDSHGGAMRCPTCDGGLESFETSELTTHWYCPDCQPDYTDRGGRAWLAFCLAIVLLAQPVGLLMEAYDRISP